MRLVLPAAVGVLMFAGSAFVPAGADPHGVVWAGSRREPNAVVWVEAGNVAPAPAPRKVVLDQRDLAFSPHVLAVRVGTIVEFPNSDRVFHNVFSFRDGKRFDLGLYPVGARKYVTFDRPGLSRIFCNIHPNMAAYVLAVESSYFAVSDADGAFSLPRLPSGRYVYHAWRPGAQTLTGSALLDGELPLEVRWP
jgi:plastocyanin